PAPAPAPAPGNGAAPGDSMAPGPDGHAAPPPDGHASPPPSATRGPAPDYAASAQAGQAPAPARHLNGRTQSLSPRIPVAEHGGAGTGPSVTSPRRWRRRRGASRRTPR